MVDFGSNHESGRYRQPMNSVYDDFDDEAQEKRRKQRLKYKQTKKRKRTDSFEDVDPDILLEDQKRTRKGKKKRSRDPLWEDRLDDEEDLLFDDPSWRPNQRGGDDDWLEELDDE